MKTIHVTDDLKFSRLSIGYMKILERGLDSKELNTFVEACLELGVTTVDHADLYGGYQCEAVFGDAVLSGRPELRKSMEIVTKADIVVPPYLGSTIQHYDTSRKYLHSQAERSLSALKTDYIDVLLLHRPDPLMDPAETADALDSLVSSGKIRYAGVSNFTPSQIASLQSHMKTRLVTNQIDFSVAFPDPLFDGTTDDAHARRMSLMAYRPVTGGRLFKGNLNESETRLMGKLEEVGKRHSATIAQTMLAWLFKCPLKLTALHGSLKLDRLKLAVAALDIDLTKPEWFELLEASRGVPVR
jgi:predicted oxidoreductase